MNFRPRLKTPQRSFFLFGPRSTGKSTWLKAHLSAKLHIDLLKNDLYFLFSSSPNAFREHVLAYDPHQTWIGEIIN